MVSQIRLALFGLLNAFVLLPSWAADDAAGNIWWYRTPAAKYWEGVPLSNGRLAAMVLGRVKDETIPINDDSLWTGSPYDPNNPEGPKILAEVRQLLLAGKPVEAQQLCQKLLSRPLSVQHYQPLGELRLRFEGSENATDYRRELDMDSALARVTYRVGDTLYTREIFASFPDQILGIRITADKPRHVSFAARLASIQPSARSSKGPAGEITMNGGVETVTKGASANPVSIPSRMRWQAGIKVIAEGGVLGDCHISNDDDRTSACVSVKDADAVTIILAAATSFVKWDADPDRNPGPIVTDRLRADRTAYAALRERHLRDWRPRFLTAKLDLGGQEAGKEDTTARLEKLRNGASDPLFEAQYFQYGRYLLLAVSRPGALPFNNHNVWLNNLEGRWQGRWTLNINLQECYWPTENTNLAQTNDALFTFVESLAEAGARTARELYGFHGWVAHHGTDIWMNTAPTDQTGPGIWPTGGPWMLQNLWEHYLYEPDANYLKRLYGLLRGSSEFFLDYLIEEPVHHWLVTAPSVSPENSFFTADHRRTQVAMGPTMDNQLLRDLFDHTIEAATKLGVDAELRARIANARNRLPPTQIGKHGQVREWLDDYEEPEVTHRHLSPLYAFYPSDQITAAKAPALVEAVRTTLERRGEENRGWSGAWKICLRARLGDGDRAESLLRRMLTDISLHPSGEDSDRVPSFEGNQGIQGVTAGIAEMLVQSHEDQILLLPALSHAWPNGRVEGLRARGGFVVDIVWREGKLNSVKIVSTEGRLCRLSYGSMATTFRTEAGHTYSRNADLK
ncbi:MAG: glycoside hydrolase family 95 protein [Bryobacteraceae bacterium]